MKSIIATAIALTISANALGFGGYGGEDYGHFSISTGSKGGVYEQAGDVLKNIAAQNGWETNERSVWRSLGTYNNLARGVSGKALTKKQAKKKPGKQTDIKFVFVQDDGRTYYMKKHPEIASAMSDLAIVGEEAVHVVGRKGHVTDEDDIEKGVKVCVDREGAGAKASMDMLGLLENDYAEATQVYKPRSSALADLSNKMGGCDVVMFVMNPMNAYAKAYKDVAGYKNLTYFNLNDWSLEGKIDGRQPYEVRKITVGYEGKRVKVKLPVTKVWLMANMANTTAEERDAMAELALDHRTTLFTPIK